MDARLRTDRWTQVGVPHLTLSLPPPPPRRGACHGCCSTFAGCIRAISAPVDWFCDMSNTLLRGLQTSCSLLCAGSVRTLHAVTPGCVAGLPLLLQPFTNLRAFSSAASGTGHLRDFAIIGEAYAARSHASTALLDYLDKLAIKALIPCPKMHVTLWRHVDEVPMWMQLMWTMARPPSWTDCCPRQEIPWQEIA